MTPEGGREVPLVFREQTPAAGRVLEVRAGTIGREGCDLNLADPEVSRRHAAIRGGGRDGAPHTIEDLGSRNGTWLNDRRIDEPTVVRAGDVVRLGNTVWHVTTA